MSTVNLRDARVLVTGGTGFLGKHLCRALDKAGAKTIPVGSSQCLEYLYNAQRLFALTKPDYVFHLGGYNGGISFNQTFPADIFFKNTTMGLNVLQSAVDHGVKKVVSVVASCAYGDHGPTISELNGRPELAHPDDENHGVMHERDFFWGSPNGSVACHGYAKRNLQLATEFFAKQYALNAVTACPTTLYGPGDSYDPARTKVMGGMVKRFVDAADAGQQEVVCWGTGAAKREFLFAPDAADLLVQTMLNYGNPSQPINLGTGQEYSVHDLAHMVALCVPFAGKIGWDSSKPDGQLRKRLDLGRMKEILPPFTPTPVKDGILATVADYRARKGKTC